MNARPNPSRLMRLGLTISLEARDLSAYKSHEVLKTMEYVYTSITL